MWRIADLGTSGATMSRSSFAAQKTPTYGFPATSRRRSKPVPQSSGRETTAEPSSNLIALMRMRRGGCSRPCFQMYSFKTSSMKMRSGLRCCFTCSRIALIALGVRSVRAAAHAFRKGTTMMRSSSCSAIGSRLQFVPAPRPLLRMAGEISLRPLDDPGGHAPIRLHGLHEAQLLRERLVLRHGSAPLDLDVPTPRDHAFEDLPQGGIVDLPLDAATLRQLDELVLDVLLQFGIGELDSAEAFPRLRRQDLPKDRLPLGLGLLAVLLLRGGLTLELLELGELLPANRLEFVVVHRHAVTRLPHTSRVPDSSSRVPRGSRGRGNQGACGPGG